MVNAYDGQVDLEMSPTDLSWHYEYAKTRLRIGKELDALLSHPSCRDAEDLGDYIEGLRTLISFMPSTREDIHRAAIKEVL
jgi:hypothetical protein